VLGVHNVRNALAAIAVGAQIGPWVRSAAEGLRAVQGDQAAARSDRRAHGRDESSTTFAHHPPAVRNALCAAERVSGPPYLGGVRATLGLVVRRVFQEAFSAAFGAATKVILAAVFRSSMPESERLDADCSSPTCATRGHVERATSRARRGLVATIVREHRAGDVVVLMSNGGLRRHSSHTASALHESAGD
jgi:UDP-N-acetylmuramate--alanine ligase